MKKNHPRPTPCTNLIVRLATFAVLLFASGERLCATPLQLTIQTNAALGFIPSAVLSWNADPGSVYLVQSKSNLADGLPWTTEEPVKADIGPMKWMAPEALRGSKYYRYVSPQPAVITIIPARAPIGVQTTFIISGQEFPQSASLLINGAPATNVAYLSPTNLQCAFTPTISGAYVFSLVVSSAVVSSFTVDCYDPTSPPAFVLQEPPTVPLGAPTSGGDLDGDACVASPGHGQTAVSCSCTHLRVLPGSTSPGKTRWGFCGSAADFLTVQPCSGEVQVDAVDMCIHGRGLDFVWGRKYRSLTGPNTAMGNRWDFSYNIRCQQNGSDMDVFDGNGRQDTFRHQTNGTYTRDEFFREGTFTNSVFRLTFADTGFWEFNPLDSSVTAGKIARCVDRNGNTLAFQYDGAGRLSLVIDDLNRTNTIAYNPSGYIQSVTDFSGRSVTYQYYKSGGPNGVNGDLLSVTSPIVVNTPNTNDFPAGKTCTYAYSTGYANDRENHLLLTVTDPTGQTPYVHVYQHNQTDLEFLRCITCQDGYSNELRTFSWKPHTIVPGQYYVTTCIMNDPVGNVTECSYDSQNRPVLQHDYTGRATPGVFTTDTANRPTGKLRSTDPDYFETSWTWNNDSLCTSETRPDGGATVMIYERDFDQNAAPRKKGDLRILRELACCGGVDADGDGIADFSQRSCYFSYDPRFSSDPSPECECNTDALENNKDAIRRTKSKTNPNRSYTAGRFALDIFGASGGGGWRDMVMTSSQPKIVDNEKGLLLFTVQVKDALGNTATCACDARGNRVKVQFPWLNDEEDCAYNSFGQLTAITNSPDANGYRRVDIATYYTNGPQTGYMADWTIDTQGPTLIRTSFEYDSRGNATRCVDPRGNDTLCTYNALDQCVRMQSPTNITSRCVTDCFYDANDNVAKCTIQVRDAFDNLTGSAVTSFDYDILDCVLHVTQPVSDAQSIVRACSYDADRNLILVSSPEAVNGHDPSNVVSYDYDERGLLFHEVRAPGTTLSSTTQHDYDVNGRETVLTVGAATAPAVWTSSYDGLGRRVFATDPMGNVCTSAYDAMDNLVYKRVDGETNDVAGGKGNRKLSLCRYTYDSLNRCSAIHQSFFDPATGSAIGDGDVTTTFTRVDNGQVTRVTDDNGHSTQYAYDTVGRLSLTTDARSNTVACAYDPNGNVITTTKTDLSDLGGAPQVFTCNTGYDPLNRCVSQTDSVGNTVQNSYDSLNDCVLTHDANGQVVFNSYDYLGRCTGRCVDMDRNGVADACTSAVWDDNSRMVSCTDANTNATSFSYDSLNRCTLVTHADTSHRSFTYDSRDNQLTSTDPNGTIITNSYDLLDRCIRCTMPPGTGVAATTTFEQFSYDGLSRCVLAANDACTRTFSYDSLGNCVAATQDGLASSDIFDGVGNCLSMTYPGGQVVQYAYDGLDRPSTVVLPAQQGQASVTLASYAYDGPARLATITRPNGVNTRVKWNGMVNPANAPGDYGWQCVNSVGHASVSQTIDRRTFAYDHNQNKIVRAQVTPFVQGGDTLTNTWSYDPLNQLTKAINTKGTGATLRSYSLDAQGNRNAVTNNGAVQVYTRDATLPQPADFQMDLYTSTPFGNELHDNNGNRIQLSSAAGVTTYQYDCRDRLVEVGTMSSSGLSPVVSFAYDALGERISKTTYPPAPASPVTIQYVHDGGENCDDRVIEERQNGAITKVYCRALDPRTRRTYPVESCAPVAVIAGGSRYFYHCDELGNVLAITDAQGSVVERCEYDDFGAPTFLTSDGSVIVDSGGLPVTSSPLGNPYLFHAMTWDSECALYCSRDCSPGPQSIDPTTGASANRTWYAMSLNPPRWMAFDNNPWSTRDCDDNDPSRHHPLQIGFFDDNNPLRHLHAEGVIHRDIAARNCSCPGGSRVYPSSGCYVLHRDLSARRVTINGAGAGSSSGLSMCDTTRLDFGQAKIRRPRDLSSSMFVMFGGMGGSGGGLRTEFAVLRQRFTCDPNNLLQGAPGDGGGDYSIEPRDILETYFETGDIPTQEQFSSVTDSERAWLYIRPLMGLSGK